MRESTLSLKNASPEGWTILNLGQLPVTHVEHGLSEARLFVVLLLSDLAALKITLRFALAVSQNRKGFTSFNVAA